MSDVHALSGAYAVDALDDVERVGFEQHLDGCAACRAEVASLREAAAELADDTAVAPPPELRAAVLDGITRVRPLPPVTTVTGPDQGDGRHEGGPASGRRWFPVLVAAVVLAIVGVGVAVWQPWQDDTTTTLTAAEQVLQAPDAEPYRQELPGGGTATIVRSVEEGKAVLVRDDLPAAPDGKAYQLWLQDPSQDLVSAGVVPPGSDPVLLEGDAADALAAGLSLEPSGGSEQPTQVLALFDFGSA